MTVSVLGGKRKIIMKEPALISIIMPVYNPGQYLHTAIMGILNQSYKHFELICIDDASTDGSAHVLVQYQEMDKRIRLIFHSKNAGAACSRNEGIRLADGKYIFFVDADDVFEKDLLERMVQTAEREVVDMVFINYDTFIDGEPYGLDIRGKYYYFRKYFSQYHEKKNCSKEILRSIPLAPYSRLYASEFIKRNQLQFQDLKSSNYVYFGIMATSLSQKIVFLDEQICLVHVRVHEGRERISNRRNPYDNFMAYTYLLHEMKRLGLSNTDIEIVQERFLENMLWELKECTLKRRKEFYEFICTEGLKEMEIADGNKSANLEPVYRRIAESFCEKSLESNWFEENSLMGYYIERSERKLIKLFEQFATRGEKCGIWGAGKDGTILAGICAENHCQCEGLIDNNEEKWGKTVFGFEIFFPYELLKIVDIVIIINQNHFNAIYDQIKLQNKKIKMVSLNLYLKHDQDLYSSTIIVSD